MRNHVPRRNALIPNALKVLKAEGYLSERTHEKGGYPIWISRRPYREETDPQLLPPEARPECAEELP